MHHGGPHLLPIQQQGIEDNTDTDTFIDLNLQFHPRKEILAEAEEEESKKKSSKAKGL